LKPTGWVHYTPKIYTKNARNGPKNTPNPPPKEKIPQGEQTPKGPWRSQEGGPEAPAKVKKEPKHTKTPPNSTKTRKITTNQRKGQANNQENNQDD